MRLKDFLNHESVENFPISRNNSMANICTTPFRRYYIKQLIYIEPESSPRNQNQLIKQQFRYDRKGRNYLLGRWLPVNQQQRPKVAQMQGSWTYYTMS